MLLSSKVIKEYIKQGVNKERDKERDRKKSAIIARFFKIFINIIFYDKKHKNLIFVKARDKKRDKARNKKPANAGFVVSIVTFKTHFRDIHEQGFLLRFRCTWYL